jgi:hypothetical protein
MYLVVICVQQYGNERRSCTENKDIVLGDTILASEVKTRVTLLQSSVLIITTATTILLDDAKAAACPVL